MHYTSFVYLPRFSSTPPESFKTGTVPVESIGPEHSLLRPLLPASFLVSFLETFVFILCPPLVRPSFALSRRLGRCSVLSFPRFVPSTIFHPSESNLSGDRPCLFLGSRAHTGKVNPRTYDLFFRADCTETRNLVSSEIIYRLYNILFFGKLTLRKKKREKVLL